jgi:hypothetical protein
MAILVPTVQTRSSAGITPTFGAANADGYALPGDGRTCMEVKNTNGSSITVTIANPRTEDGLAYANKAVTVAATTGDKQCGPYKPSIYNQISGTWAGYVLVTFSAVADVTVAFTRDP